MSSDRAEGDWGLDPDDDDIGAFGIDPCEHDYWCCKCGVHYGRGESLMGRMFAFVFALILMVIMLSPMIWLLRVCLSWAL